MGAPWPIRMYWSYHGLVNVDLMNGCRLKTQGEANHAPELYQDAVVFLVHVFTILIQRLYLEISRTFVSLFLYHLL